MTPADIRQGAWAKLEEVRAANPTALTQTYRARPAGFGSFPCAFVDEVRAVFQHVADIRVWQPATSVDIWVLGASMDNEDAQDVVDAATALVLDAFTDDPHSLGDNVVAEPVGLRSSSVDINGVTHPASVVTVGRIETQEGR